MNNKVSVIVTCYNQEKYIEQCLQSILEQTFEHWECIIVDDGSADNSSVVCESYCEKDKRFKYVFQPNQGVSAARNNGYGHSSGTFIQFLDGDDYISPEKLEVQVEYFLDNPSVDICYTNHRFYLQEKKISVRHQFKEVSGNALEDLLYGYDNGVSIPIHTALIRRSVWPANELPFPPEYTGRYEDWVFWVRIALKQAQFAFINYDFAFYRIHGSNFSADAGAVKQHAITAMNYIAGLLPEETSKQFVATKLDFFEKRHRQAATKQNGFADKIAANLRKVKSRIGGYIRSYKKKKANAHEQQYLQQLKAGLKNNSFTIISNNCWGGGVYEDLALQYTTPTVGLFFFAPCYIAFTNDLSFYLDQPLHFINESKYETANTTRKNKPYPVGLLDGKVEIHFLHYYTKREALDKWNRRKERVNYENLFLSFTDNEPCTVEEINNFDRLAYPKVFFSSQKIPGVQSLVWLSQFEKDGKIGDIYSDKNDYRKHFNVVAWLNQNAKNS